MDALCALAVQHRRVEDARLRRPVELPHRRRKPLPVDAQTLGQRVDGVRLDHRRLRYEVLVPQ